MKTNYKILHLSDLHLSSTTPKKMLKSFCDFLDNPKNVFDFVFITGDIYNYALGKSNRQDSVFVNPIVKGNSNSLFPELDTLIEKLKEKSSSIFIAYGNHDMKIYVNKNKILPSFEDDIIDGFLTKLEINNCGVQDSIISFYNKLKEILNNGSWDDIGFVESNSFYNYNELFNANKGFENFGLNKLFTSGVYFNKETTDIEPTIAIVVLNSAWLNFDSKISHGGLIIGDQVIKSIKEHLISNNMVDDQGNSVDGKYVITLMHNDFNWHSLESHHWLKIGGESAMDAVCNFSDLILCGHEHLEKKPSLVDLNCYDYKVGGLFKQPEKKGEKIDNTFSIYELNFNFNILSRKVYRYNLEYFKLEYEKNTELKPLDLQRSFNSPQRTIEGVFQILRKNKLFKLPTDIDKEILTYKDYLNLYKRNP